MIKSSDMVNSSPNRCLLNIYRKRSPILKALCDGSFTTRTVDIIQIYLTTSLTKVGILMSTGSFTTSKLSTHHLGIVDVPVIFTRCSPLVIIIIMMSVNVSL